MFWHAISAVRDLGRLHDIASILVRYGFGDLVRRTGLASALERAGRALHWNMAEEFAQMSPPKRVCMALEEMGPTFVKLGQILATRVDLFEPEWISEFSKLQDSAPAAPWEDVHRQLTEDLGSRPETVFTNFNPEPLAAASIAQVHRARLEDGSEVIVKVRRPGIRPIIEADLRWLARLAQLAEAESEELRAFHPLEVVSQFTQSLRQELDFAVECRNAERIRDNFTGYHDKNNPDGKDTSCETELPQIIIPRVYWTWTGERICVQEFITGIPGRDLQAVDQAGLDRKVLARRGAHAVLKMIVEDGYFHADPHSGNIFYLPGNRIAIIDFGMVGRLSEGRRDQLIRLLLGLVRQKPERVTTVMLDWASYGSVDEGALELEIQSFVDQYHGVALKHLSLGTMLSDLAAILRRHHLTLPADLTLLVKTFITLEGMGRELDPNFDMAGEAMPLLEQAMRVRHTPSAIIKRSWEATGEALSLLADLPQDLSRLLRAARRGRLEIHIDVTHLKRVGNQLDSAVNRLVVGIVVAALIIGSSIVMTVTGGPSLIGLSFFALFGFSGAVIGGLWLLVSIWKSSRADREKPQ
jgi:ubiquinone biosynthesis protein